MPPVWDSDSDSCDKRQTSLCESMRLTSEYNHAAPRIKGFIPLSMLDWPGQICSIIFLGGCNFRCPACHNHKLVVNPDSLPDFSMNEILSYLEGRKGWIDGVTITGGEPTVNPSLEMLLEQIVNPLGLRTKIDTNGSNPAVIKRLIDRNLISAVSMDIKAPLEFESYSRVCGVHVNTENIRNSIDIIKASGIDFFFRTTVVPGLVAERELALIKRTIGYDTPYMIQPFRNLDTLDPCLRGFPEYEMERFESMKAQYGTRLFS